MKPTAESPAGEVSTTQGTLTASVDGAAWQATPAWKQDDAAMATIDQKGLVTIRGTRTNQAGGSSATAPVEVLELTLKSTQPGTYTLEPAFANLQTATFSVGADTSQSYFIHEKQSGQAVIAESDGNHLRGTFSFDARSATGKDIRITNGAFDVTIKQ